MTAPRPRSRTQRWAPIWALALRGNKLLRSERAAHAGTRQQLVVASALVEHRAAQVADLQARCRRLDETLDCISRAKFAQIVKRNEGAT